MAQVICNDGTVEEEAIGGEAVDVRNCLNHGGVSTMPIPISDDTPMMSDDANPKSVGGVYNPANGGGGTPEDHTNDNNPRKDCNNLLDFRFHCWSNEAQIGFGIGTALMIAYGINKKKSVPAIAGLGLLGAIGGIAISSWVKPTLEKIS
jgi:hypothetical protein